LLKTLYGLKQSGRRWYQKLMEILVKHLAFVRRDVNQAVFYHHDSHNGHACIIVVVHVDDCTIAASSLSLVVAFKCEIAHHVEITNLGKLHWLLGIEIRCDRDRRTIHLSQRLYIDSILARYSLQDLKPVSTPMETSACLSSSQAPVTMLEIAKKPLDPLCMPPLALSPTFRLWYKPSRSSPRTPDLRIGMLSNESFVI